jgi:uncharacterized membrane protein
MYEHILLAFDFDSYTLNMTNFLSITSKMSPMFMTKALVSGLIEIHCPSFLIWRPSMSLAWRRMVKAAASE